MAEFERLTAYIQDYKTKSKLKVGDAGMKGLHADADLLVS